MLCSPGASSGSSRWPFWASRRGLPCVARSCMKPSSSFAHRFPDKLPKDIAKELMTIAEEVLADYTGNPRVAAFWVPRLGALCGMVCRD